MDYSYEFYRFLLFALLCEGRSNVFFRVMAVLTGRRKACRYCFRHLFAGCDKSSFNHLLALFHDSGGADLSGVLSVEVRSGLLTGSCVLAV